MVSTPRQTSLDSLFEATEPEEDGKFEEAEQPSRAFREMVAKTKEKLDRRKAKPKTIAAGVFSRALAEVDEMLRSGDWEGATAKHLVALYDRMHERCYGFEPEELGPSERFSAALLAGNMLRHRFDGDVTNMVNFMLWAWERELGTEKWRRENKVAGRRIGVRLMFSGNLLSDYRVDLARRGVRS